MALLFNLLNAVSWLLSLYSFVVIAACVISWVSPDPFNPIVRMLRILTEPVLWRIRKYLPFTYINGLDLSPLVLLLAIQLVQRVVITSFIQMLF